MLATGSSETLKSQERIISALFLTNPVISRASNCGILSIQSLYKLRYVLLSACNKVVVTHQPNYVVSVVTARAVGLLCKSIVTANIMCC